jgi:hypothetical protein
MLLNEYMKKICFTVLVMLLSTGAIANDPRTTGEQTEATAAQGNIRIVTRPEIVGLWGMQIPSNNKCVEYYNFRSSNDVIIKSGEEWSSGIYDYQPSVDTTTKLPALVLQVKYDNNEKDCSGYQQDQSGEISQYFVKWKNPQVIDFCTNDKAEQCFATLYRILP